jgi:hypothetical protein
MIFKIFPAFNTSIPRVLNVNDKPCWAIANKPMANCAILSGHIDAWYSYERKTPSLGENSKNRLDSFWRCEGSMHDPELIGIRRCARCHWIN